MPRDKAPAAASVLSASAQPQRRLTAGMLACIVLVGAALRIGGLADAPPGLNQDEAANAWNAWCLLKTGKDQTGKPWPIFYTRCHGGNSSTLYLYWMIPFQAVGGLNVWTTRLPSAVAGALTLPLLAYVGRRMFGPAVGLVAAALLALSPWHIQQTRWGHEAAIMPLLICGTLALMLRANLPFNDDERRPPKPVFAALAGAAAGLSCYGYQSLRLFLPVFLVTCVLVTARAWLGHLRTPAGRRAIGLMLAAGLVTFGPLAYKHVTDGEEISKQLRYSHAWNDADPLPAKFVSVAKRYVEHYGPGFLFVRGDRFKIQSPPGMGQLDLYLIPLLLTGLGWAVRNLRASRAARVLLVWLATFPVGDCLSGEGFSGAHALRSLTGVAAFMLLAAVGAVAAFQWLRGRLPRAAPAATIAMTLVAVAFNVRFMYRFCGEYSRDPQVYLSFQTDLLEACRWLKPRFDQADAVFCTTTRMNQPYIIMLLGLDYDPRRWLEDKPVRVSAGNWDQYLRFGKVHFVFHTAEAYAARALMDLKNNGRLDRVYYIARPDEPAADRSEYDVLAPDGTVTLRIYEQTL